MAKRMLIDATHSEETRAVVVSGNRLEEFDFETTTKKQLKGNIYLAKVTRVEPSLQAAFVDYGGNRHGFLAFSEIHPDYYRIPIADREALLAEATQAAEEDDDDEDDLAPDDAEDDIDDDADEVEPVDEGLDGDDPQDDVEDEDVGDAEGSEPLEARPDVDAEEAADDDALAAGESAADPDSGQDEGEPATGTTPLLQTSNEIVSEELTTSETGELPEEATAPNGAESLSDDASPESTAEPGRNGADASDEDASNTSAGAPAGRGRRGRGRRQRRPSRGRSRSNGRDSDVETVGGDDVEDFSRAKAWHRRYRIQEVISRRQILLVQVAKEERGNKGAALTTYISLAGRYCVLMPNTPRGGGISRKISSVSDRRKLKEIVDELNIPMGMAVIVRTAGAERTKAEIRRDYEYLMKLWDEIRERTLQSTAPAIIHEEANLIKRSIRDLYTKDIDEVLVEGEDGYKTAKQFMKLLMPSHAKRVKSYKEESIPLFHRYQVETQMDQIHSPTVQLKSGGYVVLNPTEALVAIDVNSGRATRERNIEETAYRTNLEAADEIARQLRLRDLAGLIVIDFIDMEEGRNRINVERRLKEALRHDRARIQLGRISAFGLMEMSRQRLRPSITEVSGQVCPHCGGSGVIRSIESAALQVLRSIEEEGMRQRAGAVTVATPPEVAIYILNNKRTALSAIEERYEFRVYLTTDDRLVPPDHRIEQGAPDGEEEPDAERTDQRQKPRKKSDAADDDEGRGKRKRSRSRSRSRKREEDADAADTSESSSGADAEAEDQDVAVQADGDDESGGRRPRRRGRRGGRRRRKSEVLEDEETGASATAENDSVEITAVEDDPAEAPQPPASVGGDADDGESAPKPRRRRRRSPSRGAKSDESASATETSSEVADEDPGSDPAPATSTNGATQPPAAASKEEAEPGANGAVADEADKGSSGPSAEPPDTDADSDEPKRRRGGWWNLGRGAD